MQVKLFILGFLCLVLMNIVGFVPEVWATVFNVSTSPGLSSALTQATAGDEIIVADGTYSGNFSITANSGTAINPITLRAANRHQAIFQGDGIDADNDEALDIRKSYWIIDGFEIKNYSFGIEITTAAAAYNEIRHNIIHNFSRYGIRVDDASSNHYIHHNVSAFSSAPSFGGEAGGIVINDVSTDTRVEHNIVYSITNDGHQCGDAGGCAVGAKRGYGITVHSSSNNTLRGNLVMDGAKGTIRVLSTPSDPAPANNNIVQDNLIAFSEGGGLSLGDAEANFNLVTNNLVYGIYFVGFSAKGNDPGQNTFQHNTVILTPFSRRGTWFLNNDSGVPSKDTVIKNNLFYASFAKPSTGSQYLHWVQSSWASTIQESNYNLFWRPGGVSTWTSGVTYGANDIHASGNRPTFIGEAYGDFALASGSYGKNAASDGTDMGASFNTYLKKQWMENVFALPTQEQNTSGTSVSFTTSASHQYQVYVYVPESSPYQGIETFSIEGQTIQRDYGNTISLGYISSAPQRWVYLGTHPNDGALNITWGNANAASKILVRQLPTPSEAYQWVVVPSTVLVFTNSPVTTIVNALMPLVTVCIDDTAGVRQNVTDSIALTIGTDANPTTILTGGTGGASTAGCRAFPNVLSLDKTGTGYKLRATCATCYGGPITKDSGFFNSITQPTAPTGLTIGRVQ